MKMQLYFNIWYLYVCKCIANNFSFSCKYFNQYKMKIKVLSYLFHSYFLMLWKCVRNVVEGCYCCWLCFHVMERHDWSDALPPDYLHRCLSPSRFASWRGSIFGWDWLWCEAENLTIQKVLHPDFLQYCLIHYCALKWKQYDFKLMNFKTLIHI